MSNPCRNCKFGFGWDWDPTYGWVGCGDCNDDGKKLKPVFRDWIQHIVFYSLLDALEQFETLKKESDAKIQNQTS